MIWNLSQVLKTDVRSEGTEELLNRLQKRVEEKWGRIPSSEIDKWLNEKHGDWIIGSFSIND